MNLKKSHKKHAVYAILLLIVLYTVTYSISCAIGPSHMGDDIAYAFYAHQVSAGSFTQSPGDILSLRTLQIIPIGFFYKLFGAGAITSAAWDIVSFVLSVILVFLIGREIYDDRVGLLAAFLLSIFPLAAVYSTTMSDSIPMMFFVCLEAFAFIKAMKEKSRLWFFAAGATFVALPLTTPQGLEFWIILGTFALAELVRKKLSVDRTSLFFIYGLVSAMLALFLFNYVNVGYPFITFSKNLQYYGQTQRPDLIPLPLDTALSFYPSIMFPYDITGAIYQVILNGNPTNLIGISGFYANSWALSGFFFYALVFSALYLAIRKDRNAYFPLAWFVIGILYLEFGPQSIGLNPFTYVLSHRLDRYLTLVAPPLVIIISAALITVVRTAKKEWIGTKMIFCALVILFITVTSLQITLFAHDVALAAQYPQLQAAKYLQAVPNTTRIYTDSGFGDVAVYMNFNNLTRFYFDYDGLTNCSAAIAGSYALVPTQFQNPFSGCSSNWTLVLSPQPTNFSQAVISNVHTLANLYHVVLAPIT